MFGIGMGPSKDEKTQYNNLSGASSWSTSHGEADINQSTDFMKSILSGDPGKIGQVLAPQIRGIQDQGQEDLKKASIFGNRSGGTNAFAQTSEDKTRSHVNDLISSLTGSAVSGLNRTGTGLLDTGMSGFSDAFGEAKTMADQHAAKMNDIMKSSEAVVAGVATGGASFAMPGGMP